MKTIIEFKDVGQNFDGQQVLEHLNLEIKEGEIFVLVGPSGSGKTTSLKMINGLVVPTEGNVYFKNKRIKDYPLQKLRWQIGYVLQQIALFPTMTVKENIELIPEMLGWDKKRRRARVDELLREVALDPATYRDRLPGELSGGQQQRIGILRAIAAEPDVILMDEPFSALDPISRTSLQELVLKLHQKLGNTVIFVTHNMKEALKLGDRIAVMHHGKLVQCDTPDVIQNQPKTDFVQQFFNETAGDLTDQTLQALYTGGFYQRIKHVEPKIPRLSVTEHLGAAFDQLVTWEYFYLTEQDQLVGEVSRSDIFRFLSQGE
ncbi:ABC transporter ATP-binding protein [Enterococcus sp. CSURQ0835]|uniref:ABC transporter ATP-binding protein n=1 Tax=Enterococcus sp. CSURQ0835 TaxID=2681394 RepID=UPI00135A0296|nr:ABC transporter ATP-binding protein [Enterococcus sp. CSURQ0835]